MKKWTLLLVGLMWASWGFAENSTRAGDYVIHHNAFTSTTLSPKMAQLYGISRSGNRGMINISVVKGELGRLGEPVAAEVEAKLKRLTGQESEIPLREVREDGAIYYIGTFPVVHGEFLRFHLSVRPKGSDRFYPASLTQEFFSQ
jgi:hypothetical protein